MPMSSAISAISLNGYLTKPNAPNQPNQPNQPNPPNPYIYSDIVLCVKTSVHAFECYKFNSYDMADKYFKENFSKSNEENFSESNKKNIYYSTMVPLSKMWPGFIEPYILQLKMSNIFNNIKINKP